MATIAALALTLASNGCASDDGEPTAAPSPSLSLPDLPDGSTTDSPTTAFAEGPEEPTQVVYELDTTAGTEQITIAWEDDRFALVRGDGRLLRDGDGQVVFCTDGPTPGDDICWGLEDRGEPFLQRVAADLLAVYGLAALLPDDARAIDDANIAGRTARCVEFTPEEPLDGSSPVPVDRTEFCYDEDTGVGLRLIVEAGEQTQQLEASSYGAPDDGVFEPTAPVQPYPEGGMSPGAPTAPATP